MNKAWSEEEKERKREREKKIHRPGGQKDSPTKQNTSEELKQFAYLGTAQVNNAGRGALIFP